MDNKPEPLTLQIPLFIEHARQGEYFTIPFKMPENIETFTLAYLYPRRAEYEAELDCGRFTARPEVNIVDLGLIDPSGAQVGVSGSNKTEIFVSETAATPGYQPCRLAPGEWRILVGAYKVAEAGVSVRYELTFVPKHRRLLKGDLHTHTIASDGALSLEQLVGQARLNGLDYLAITDHNQVASPEVLLQYPGITLIPGMEWTHFHAHANMLGCPQPYDGPFFANTMDEVRAHFESAHRRGALIVLNHPKDGFNPFEFELEGLPFDCIEAWKGFFLEYNYLAIAWWQSMLVAGKKVPIVGGSDFHKNEHKRFPGAPCTQVYAMSAGAPDILSALRQGHSFITFEPAGPTLELTAGEARLGDSVAFSQVSQLDFSLAGLNAGDSLILHTASASIPLGTAPADGELRGRYAMPQPGFAWLEVQRQLAPNLPLLPVLISNPIYFDG